MVVEKQDRAVRERERHRGIGSLARVKAMEVGFPCPPRLPSRTKPLTRSSYALRRARTDISLRRATDKGEEHSSMPRAAWAQWTACFDTPLELEQSIDGDFEA